MVRRRWGFPREPVERCLAVRRLVERLVERVEIHGHVPPTLERRDRPNVIDMRMRQPDRLGYGADSVDRPDDALALGAWVDDRTLRRDGIYQEVAVLLKSPDGERGDRPVHVASHSRVNVTGASAVSSTGDSPSPWCASQRSASSAAMHPVPAAVIA